MTSVMSNEGWRAKQHLTGLVAERDEQTFRTRLPTCVTQANAAARSSTDQGAGIILQKVEVLSTAFATLVVIGELRTGGDDSWLVHTNTPSVPSGQRETNATGLAATSKAHNGA